MSTELVLLALLMGAVTYPSRALPLLAPGLERLPPRAFAYLRLVGPGALAALAAVNMAVVTDRSSHPALHVGIAWPAVGLCILIAAWRRNLLVGICAAVVLAAITRAAGLG